MKSMSIDDALESKKPSEAHEADEADDNLFPLMEVKEAPLRVKDVDSLNIEQDIKDDYTNAREAAQHLLEQQQSMIKSMVDFCNTCPSPRAYEVMNNMMKNGSDMVDKLLAIQIQLKEAQEEAESLGSNSGDTYVFTGGPSSILAEIKKAAEAEAKVIDITPEK